MIENFVERLFEKNIDARKKSNLLQQGRIPERDYHLGTINHLLMPKGGRDLSTYERQLLFNRAELSGKTVLDLGSGPELKLAKELAQLGITSDVVSFSPDFLDSSCSQKAKESFGGYMVAGLGQSLPFADQSFDKILVFHVDEHISLTTYQSFILEMARVLKVGGEARYGPTCDIPGEFDSYKAILDNEELAKKLAEYQVKVKREFIPEEVMPKMKVKDSYANAFYLPSHVVVLSK